MQRNEIVVGLLWHSLNSDNLGVGALTVAHMKIIDDAANRLNIEVKYIIICWKDERQPYFSRPNIEIKALRMTDFARLKDGLISAVQRCDIVLDIGAGDSFADIYGASRIVKMLLAQNIVLFLGKPLVLSPQTIGPFKNPLIRRLATNVMNRTRAVVTRDTISSDFTRSMSQKCQLIEATDVALLLPYDTNDRVKCAGEKIRVGINVSGLLFHGGYNRNNMFDLTVDYSFVVRNIIEYFLVEHDCEVHLIGHVLTRSFSQSQPMNSDKMLIEDDYQTNLILAKHYPGVIVAPEFVGPSDAKSYIATMDFMLGARMHACIAALSSGVPVLPMAYSRKFAGMFGTIGYHCNVDCTKESGTEIMSMVKEAFLKRKTLKQQADAAFHIGVERLTRYRNLLEDCFAEIIQ